tara:strand:- start:1868 stop:3706 length:1839 start_codon:yes stop_codon:yes gene_type:complete
MFLNSLIIKKMNKNFLEKIVGQNRQIKKAIVIANDGIVCISTFILLCLIYNGSFTFDLPFILFQLLIILIFYFNKLYDNVIKHLGSNYFYKLFFSLIIPHLLYFSYIELYGSIQNYQFLILSNFFTTFSLIILSRNVAKTLLYRNHSNKENIAFYAGKDFDSSVIESIKSIAPYSTIAIINDNKDNRGLIINGIKVYSTSDINYLIKKKNLKKLFITSQKNILNLKKVILRQLSNSPLKIIEIPDVNDFIKENSTVDSLNDLSLEDLIGKRKYDLNIDTSQNNFFEGKNILITGAGGSIGSVLSEQLASYNPNTIILVDHSESSLFQVQQKLIINNNNLKIFAKPIDLSDKLLIEDLFKSHDVDVVYHAAAYKHVNLLEENILPAVKNNIFGLFHLINLCEHYNVKKFILVSTDKAVKPSTVMGMTKKFCEQMIFNFKENTNCKYSAVRFGNVFNSSGSVIPIFKKQIKKDRVVTVTDKNVTRYFMSIDEAVHLVIRSSFISKGNEIFILDMGKPKKIFDLAKQMIHLSGYSIKSNDNPNGEVEIKITGLGSSEKLHEELTEFGYEKTIEKKIFVSKDSDIKNINFEQDIAKLEELLKNSDKEKILNFLRKV